MNFAINAAGPRLAAQVLASPESPPPHEPQGLNAGLIASLPRSRFDAVALNPQPLPPKESRFDAVALNPQPLPPKESGLAGLVNAFLHRFDAVALNPQPLPPGPPDPDRLRMASLIVNR